MSAASNSVALSRGQTFEPQLRVRSLAAPAVLVLGAIIHQQQESGSAETFHDTVEQGLGLAIDPVQVLEDYEQRMHLGLAQQQALDRIERALAPLRRVDRTPGRALDRHVQ